MIDGWTDWMDWDGGDAPPDELKGCEGAQLKFRSGEASGLLSWIAVESYSWLHDGGELDIVAYRYKPAGRPERDGRAVLDVQVGGDHYKTLAIQPVEYIHANKIGFLEGSVIKYVTRWRNKNGIEDLKKARHFIDLLIEFEQGGRDAIATESGNTR
ncbi:DUF3310 domain-containing protein [Microbulbifer thermotolerans]|uniref:DUF3310 domain-containing protein n=1 Tax=Microbulbifer thermotolerans TaxID=252514 RepID=A0AB35HYA5_MICTH|nr:DUF3310 domain-containing protein [Microbulbifer thermotolerans]MCX2802244.1 DUF3310 domain-containing protein [Microbulbifer thermotolerans]